MSLWQHNPNGSSSEGMHVATPLGIAEVADRCASPWGLEAYSPLGTHPYLLLDAGSKPVAASILVAICERLRSLPCPVIALGEPVDDSLLRGVDVVVGSEREAATIIANITNQPLAATTLVQLLRHNEDSAPEQGLLAESLAYAALQGSRSPQLGEPDTSRFPAEGEELVRVERQADELHVVLNRPEALNAYSAGMRDALYETLLLLKADATLRSAVIRGEGRCFSIGGDLNEFGVAPDPATAHAIRSSRNVAALLLELGDRLEFRLHRACIGAGIELPAFGARVLADSNTFVQLPEIRLGLLPGAGGTVSLLRRIGRHRTAYLALSGRRVNAATAYEWGLVDGLL